MKKLLMILIGILFAVTLNAQHANNYTYPIYIGKAGTSTGSITLYGTTSGSIQLKIPDIAGTSIVHLNYVDATSSIQTQINTKATNQDINDTIDAYIAGASVGVALADSGVYDGGYVTPTDLDAIDNNLLKGMQNLGSTVVALPMACIIPLTTLASFVDGEEEYLMFYFSKPQTITGVKFVASTGTGDFTGDKYNGFKLYSVSGTTYTRVDSTANDHTIFETPQYTVGTKAFVGGATLYPAGNYVVGMIYNESAHTTIPKMSVNYPMGSATKHFMQNTHRLYGLVAGDNDDLPVTITTGDVSDGVINWGFWLY